MDAQAAGPGTGGWGAADAQAGGPGTGVERPGIADAAARDLRMPATSTRGTPGTRLTAGTCARWHRPGGGR